MRGFSVRAVAAAAATATLGFVTPVLADAPAYELPGFFDNAAAFFQVKLNQDHPELIRLDVANTAGPCDPKTLSINNQELLLGANHLGRGPLTLDSGSVIEALWTITCVTHDQDGQLQFSPGNISPVHEDQFANMQPGMWVVVDILKVDGEETHAGFEANFVQGGDYVKWHFADVYGPDGVDENEVKLITHFGKTGWIVPWDAESIRRAERELGWLQANGKEWATEDDENHKEEGEDDVLASDESASSLDEAPTVGYQAATEFSQPVREKCNDFACLMGQIKDSMTIEEFKEIDAQAEELVREILGKQTKKQKPLTTTETPTQDAATVFIMSDSQNMKPITTADESSVVASDVPTATPTGLFLAALPPQDQDLLLTLFLAGTAFLLFTVISLFIFKARPEPSIQRLPLHRETREERLARVANRRAAFKTYLSRLLCGLFSLDEKNTDQPQGHDCRRQEQQQRQGQEEGTMQQELERFREAANMVESMIAAEEGRNQQVAVSTPPAEASPPSYETDTAESGVVADGFRYTRLGHEAAEEPTREGSDRLGYGNKD